MNRNNEQRRDLLREHRIEQALRALRRDEIVKGLQGLVTAQARVELAHCLGKLPSAVIDQLQLNQSKTAIAAYKLLEDDNSLLVIAERLLSDSRHEECLEAVLSLRGLTPDDTWNPKRAEFLVKFLEKGAFREVSQLVRTVYPSDKVSDVRHANPETYSTVINGIQNHLFSMFHPEKPERDTTAVRASLRHMMDVLQYCGEYGRVQEFYDNCETSEDYTMWRYHAGKTLLEMSQGTHRAASDKVIEYMGMAAFERDDDHVIGLVLTHRFNRDSAMTFATKLMEKGNYKQAQELLIKVLEDDGAQPDVVQGLRTLLARMMENPSDAVDGRKKKRK